MTECTDDSALLLDREEDEQKSELQQESEMEWMTSAITVLSGLLRWTLRVLMHMKYCEPVIHIKGKISVCCWKLGTWSSIRTWEAGLCWTTTIKPVILFILPLARYQKHLYMRSVDGKRARKRLQPWIIPCFLNWEKLSADHYVKSGCDRLASRMKRNGIFRTEEKSYRHPGTPAWLEVESHRRASFWFLERLMLFITGMEHGRCNLSKISWRSEFNKEINHTSDKMKNFNWSCMPSALQISISVLQNQSLKRIMHLVNVLPASSIGSSNGMEANSLFLYRTAYCRNLSFLRNQKSLFKAKCETFGRVN